MVENRDGVGKVHRDYDFLRLLSAFSVVVRFLLQLRSFIVLLRLGEAFLDVLQLNLVVHIVDSSLCFLHLLV